LIEVVYRELRRVASARLRGFRGGQSLDTTELVHETYMRLVELDRLRVTNRIHFFAIAARLMRQIVVDEARRRGADKRGGGAMTVRIAAEAASVSQDMVDVLTLDQALEELMAMEERLCRVVELRFFAGMTIEEAADALDLSTATVERDWAVAKAWLYDRLGSRQ
jgi:RNA polymerase sigma factor (TIGR02999 family)